MIPSSEAIEDRKVPKDALMLQGKGVVSFLEGQGDIINLGVYFHEYHTSVDESVQIRLVACGIEEATVKTGVPRWHDVA